ncbi:MAG: CRISPR-associated protein Cas4 [Neomegalonema sp.]|nr:CRISPR-associated protein Cas4 [Neomegalonema sp.]
MSEDADLISLSALQHWLVCPRQCALIHVEQVWAENALTVEGQLMHQEVDVTSEGKRKGVRTATGMPIASQRLGVSGIADVVEFPTPNHPYPVEYKLGRPKAHRADEVQLCAQAMALEEMFAVDIPEGALFYGRNRRRTVVAFDEDLRSLTKSAAKAAREVINAGCTPSVPDKRQPCRGCSLKELCRPDGVTRLRSTHAWIERQLQERIK